MRESGGNGLVSADVEIRARLDEGHRHRDLLERISRERSMRLRELRIEIELVNERIRAARRTLIEASLLGARGPWVGAR